MVVRLDAGREAVRGYVAEQAEHGLEHVRALVTSDNDTVLSLIADLTEDEGLRITPVDPWSVFMVLQHMAASLDRSKARLEALSSGQPFTNPPAMRGRMGSEEYESFDELRRFYAEGMAAVLAILERVEPKIGLELTAEHAEYGPFNWLEWATYSHHVHTHDHIGQLQAIRSAMREA
jgi:hypothetical protein